MQALRGGGTPTRSIRPVRRLWDAAHPGLQQGCNRAATELQQSCNRAATGLQQECNRSATGQQQSCDSAATGLQQGCTRAAANLRQCCNRAVTWLQRGATGQQRGCNRPTRGGRRASNARAPTGVTSSHASGGFPGTPDMSSPATDMLQRLGGLVWYGLACRPARPGPSAS